MFFYLSNSRKFGSFSKNSLIFILLLVTVFPLFGDKSSHPSQSSNQYKYQKPEKLDDGWKVSSLEAEGIDTQMITQLTQKIIDSKFRGIHSMAIVKNGALVHEAYFKGYNRDSLHKIHSITKSISSALIGIAIGNKYIQSADQSIMALLTEYADSFKDEKKQAIKLKHILTLTSGWDWDEKQHSYSDPRNSEYRMMHSGDWVKYVLDLPMKDEPGLNYVYNTGSVHVLSAIIKSTTGLFTNTFAEKYLFKPLGIKEYEWNTDDKGNPCTGGTHGGLRMRTRDLAKFGYLFLNEGKWKGQKVVPAVWVKESTRTHVTSKNRRIGYLWWQGSYFLKQKKIERFYGAGYGGQSLHIVPELDLMIVLTCWSKAKGAHIFGPILTVYNAILKE